MTSPDTPSRRVISPQPTGLFIAMAGVCFTGWGVWIGVPAAFALGVVLLAGWLLDVIILGVANPWRRARVTRRITPHPIQAGQTIEVRISIVGFAMRSVGWQSCEDITPWDDDWVTADGNELTRSKSGARWNATYRSTAIWRGIFKVGPLRLLASSPLGFWRAHSLCDLRSGLVVWPATAPMTVPPVIVTDNDSTSGIGLPRPHLDDTTLREYQPGDDLHRIHWRSLARSNTLLTRAEEPSDVRQTLGTVLMGDGVDPDLVDLSLGLLASWGDAMTRSGQVFAISLGDRWLTQPSHQELMDVLAAVNESELREIAPVGRQYQDNAIIIAVAGPSDKQIDVPDIASGGIAVVLAAASVKVKLPHDWDLLRLAPATSLQGAAMALQKKLVDRRGSSA